MFCQSGIITHDVIAQLINWHHLDILEGLQLFETRSSWVVSFKALSAIVDSMKEGDECDVLSMHSQPNNGPVPDDNERDVLQSGGVIRDKSPNNRAEMLQMTQLDRAYDEMLIREVVTLADAKEIIEKISNRAISRRAVVQEYLTPLIDRGRMERVRRGLYVIGVPEASGELMFSTSQGMKKQSPDKFLIGAKIRERGFLSHHTALEVHGASQTFGWGTVYVSVSRKKRFRSFEYRGILYTPVSTKDPSTGISKVKHRGQEILVSTPERTFIDCLERVDLGGGWEEVLKGFSQLRLRDSAVLVKLLEERRNQTLIRRVGIMLDRFNEAISNYIYMSDFEKVRARLQALLKGRSLYIDRGLKDMTNAEMTHDREWRVYYPRNFWENYERGV